MTIYEVFVMTPAGTGVARLRTDTITLAGLDWSLDGGKIALQRGSGIAVMNADGAGFTQLTTDRHDFSPAWSPDGSQIAFHRSFDVAAEIWIMEADGSEPGKVTSNTAFDGDPAWQPVPFAGEHPDCSAVSASSPVIYPPARDMFELVTLGGASDPDGDPVTLTITRVTQDEPVTTAGDDTTPDARPVAAKDQVELRAERNPKRDGRVYRLHYVVSDGRGGSCRGMVKVSVPRHRAEPAIDSAPPSFDSFSP